MNDNGDGIIIIHFIIIIITWSLPTLSPTGPLGPIGPAGPCKQ